MIKYSSMKNRFKNIFITTITLGVLISISQSVKAATNDVAVLEEKDTSLSFDLGGEFRLRQELAHNIPGMPGGPNSVLPKKYKKNLNHFRFRTQVWGRIDWDKYTLFTRIANECREHIVKNGVRRKDRAYNFPDEVFLDNLYLEGRGLVDDFIDFRIGRFDMFGAQGSLFELDHIFVDGTPYDGSRSLYTDMANITFHTTENSQLDTFFLYDSSRNDIRWGTPQSRGRALNAIHAGDDADMDEWGGGVVWSQKAFDGALPYKLYSIYKHNEDFSHKNRRYPDKQTTTIGVKLLPQITDELSFDLEGAKQFGSFSNNKQVGGYMGYAAVDFHPKFKGEIKPYAKLSVLYLSGSKHTYDPDHNDTSWDPMWSRGDTSDSELFQYGTYYGFGWNSNMIHPKLKLGSKFGKYHSLYISSGPMFADKQDGYGRADGDGTSRYKGLKSIARYDFPLLIAPKDASGVSRFEIYCHIIGELFNPGNYYETSRPAYFIRWQVTFKF